MSKYQNSILNLLLAKYNEIRVLSDNADKLHYIISTPVELVRHANTIDEMIENYFNEVNLFINYNTNFIKFYKLFENNSYIENINKEFNSLNENEKKVIDDFIKENKKLFNDYRTQNKTNCNIEYGIVNTDVENIVISYNYLKAYITYILIIIHVIHCHNLSFSIDFDYDRKIFDYMFNRILKNFE